MTGKAAASETAVCLKATHTLLRPLPRPLLSCTESAPHLLHRQAAVQGVLQGAQGRTPEPRGGRGRGRPPLPWVEAQ